MAIKFTYGGRNYEEAFEAFGEIAETFKKIKKEVGELTPLFNQIADPLVDRIQARFDNDVLNKSPYNQDAPGAKRSIHTKLVH